MCLEIRKFSIEDGRDTYEMLQELPANENGFINSANGKTFEEYKAWLKKCVRDSEQEGIVDGWKVPSTGFWLYENGKPVGIAKVRHFLTDALLKEGGNVGYAIRPSARNRGLGKKFLSLLMPECKKLGVDRILLTIQNDNKPSIGVGLANGGAVEKVMDGRHYIWIDL